MTATPKSSLSFPSVQDFIRRRRLLSLGQETKATPPERQAGNMDKRYQVFVSYTFADLQEERQAVMQALLSLDHFPAGMELFPASDEDQLALIKGVIDDSDYYVLV